MKEKIYTIPVNDAFQSNCECPICSMYRKLEQDAVEYTMGPSYMEDDIRAVTDAKGFCEKHLADIYHRNNRLGFALVMKTHLDKVIQEVEAKATEPAKGKPLFKKADRPSVSDYISKINCSCFICDRINQTFQRYIDTIFVMYQSDSEFQQLYESGKGFCTRHYGLLMETAPNKLSGTKLASFTSITTELYLKNMKRVRDDVAWFINKFDHKYANEPWYEAKDALLRAITKDASFFLDE